MMLFINVNLIPMTAEKVIANQAVLVEGTIITAMGSLDQIRVPDNEIIIDGSGAYLLPGLADMHMHTRETWIEDFFPVSPFYLYLANGITTIRDFGPIGDDPTYILKWRDEINDGSRVGPFIYSSGTPLFGPVTNPGEMIRAQKDQGFDFTKLYSFLTKSEFHEAMKTAKQLGVYTAGHIPVAIGLDDVLAAGMDEIAHIEELDLEFIEFDRGNHLEEDEWLAYIMKEAFFQYELHLGLDLRKLKARIEAAIPTVVEQLKVSRAAVCTTMVVGHTIVEKLFWPERFLARSENRYLPPTYLEVFRKGEERHQKQFRGYENLAIFKCEIEKLLLAELQRAGITLLLSTDSGTGSMGVVPGFSIHQELQIMVDNGFTPYEAISTGTVNASNVIQRTARRGDFGTIELGKRADLILVRENPLDNVANLKDLLGVMASGRWYSKETLEQMITPGIHF